MSRRCRDDVGVILRRFRDNAGMMWGLCCGDFGIISGRCRDDVGVMLGRFRDNVGTVFGMISGGCRDDFGMMSGRCWG